MASFVFTKLKKLLLDKGIDLVNDSLYVRLTTAALTVNDDMDTVTELTEFVEHDGANYPAGGAALASKTATLDNANDRAVFDAADLTFTALGAAAATNKGALIVKHVDGGANDIPLIYFEWAAPVTNDGTDWAIKWSSSGIAYIG